MDNREALIKDEEIRERAKHAQTVQDIRVVLTTPSGRALVKYLFESFELTELPEIGMEGNLLYDKLGSLRPGRLFFNIVSEANPEMAGTILAQITKEKYA